MLQFSINGFRSMPVPAGIVANSGGYWQDPQRHTDGFSG